MMSVVSALGIVAAFWCLLFVCDRAIKLALTRRWSAAYLQLLEACGISLSFAQVRCYTTRLNGAFKRLGTCNRPLSRSWFGTGALIGVVLMFSSVGVLCYTLYQGLVAEDNSQQVLTPVMPGVNLPWKDIVYYLFTLVLCGVFHEAGHALCASAEHVRVNGFGVFVLFLYPGAFVSLHSDHLTVISPLRQLRIYCAGVWHNVILALFFLGLLWSLPMLLFPFYSTGRGAVVVSVLEGTALTDKLVPGELITSINKCLVFSVSDMELCIESLSETPQTGYCVSADLLSRYEGLGTNGTAVSKDGVRECCESGSLSDICFDVVYGKGRGPGKPSRHACLTARTVSAREACSNPRDCDKARGGDHACAFPTVLDPTRLARIGHTGGSDVLYLGDPQALSYFVHAGDYLPKLPFSFMLPVPSFLHTLSMYVVSFSSALALLNMVPAFALDGQWALVALLEHYCERTIPNPRHRNTLCTCVLSCGTFLLMANICLALWTLARW